MKKFKKKKDDNYIFGEEYDDLFEEESVETTEEQKDTDDKFDVNAIAIVVERVEHGLIGSLRIENEMNKPIFKKNDIVHLRAPSRIERKDFILYKSHDEYFLRRIIKYKGDDIYVAGDNERECHIIHKEDIVGKVIGRQRKKKYLSFSLNPKKPIYTFAKVNLSYLRLRDRVLGYEDDVNNEAFETAMHNVQHNVTEAKKEDLANLKYDIDLDSDLASFLDPDQLVNELLEAQAEAALEEDEEYEEYEEYDEDGEYVEYVDEDGNVVSGVAVEQEEDEEALEDDTEEVENEEALEDDTEEIADSEEEKEDTEATE